ncbi:hypothetical protein FKM82_028818 [Ascaphus truei]
MRGQTGVIKEGEPIGERGGAEGKERVFRDRLERAEEETGNNSGIWLIKHGGGARRQITGACARALCKGPMRANHTCHGMRGRQHRVGARQWG